MERVEFLIEQSHQRLPCMLNPESLTIQRSTGAQRVSRQLVSGDLSDDPVSFAGRGDTTFQLELLFDIRLGQLPAGAADVRVLTGPLWRLSEHVARARSDTDVVEELPAVRFIWGTAWNIRVVVQAISEKYQRFAPDGRPESSLVTLGMLRIGDRIASQQEMPPPVDPIRDVHTALADEPDGEAWEVHILHRGERLSQIAAAYYGFPDLWRLIAIANNVDNPLALAPGTPLRIPPRHVLR